MSTRLVLALATAPLFLAATAHAQAPGDYAQPPGDYSEGDTYAGPSAAPIVPPQVVVAPPPPPTVGRLSVALGIGSLSLSPQETMGDQSTEFAIGEIAVRYRPWRHLELELSFAGGNQQLSEEQGGGEGDLKIAHVTLAARYRFGIENHFNWWLMAGFGGTTIAPKDASSDEAEMQQRGHGMLGIGAEYRWTHFALQAEAKGIGVGPTEAEQKYADDTGMDATGLGGGSFTLAGAYYF
jgi:hypothetical protein